MILTIKIDQLEQTDCTLCNQSFYTKKRPLLYSGRHGWVGFCSDHCFNRWLKIEDKEPEMCSERELLWWSNWMKHNKNKELKVRVNVSDKLAHWLNVKNTGSKTGQKLAQKTGSSLPLLEGEPLSRDPVLILDHEPILVSNQFEGKEINKNV